MTKQPKREKKFSSDSFLEAFRDLGSNFVDSFKNDVVKGTGKGIMNTLTGNQKPSSGSSSVTEKNNFSDFLFQKEADLEKKYQRQARWQSEIAKKQEQIIYTRQDREIQLQVKALQQEIQQLTKASEQLSKEAEIASFNLPPEVGAYHLTFFERLRNLIKALKSKIQESSFWLAEWNKKAKKKNYYWGQFKKSGSKFLLSSDRNVATQTG